VNASSAEEILRRADEEGVEVGVLGGHLTYRGASPSLRLMLQDRANEREVVEYLGEEYGAWRELMRRSRHRFGER
jgi:dissimilatory sulfite reductase (desulfoviridin) alpha/beta subunit